MKRAIVFILLFTIALPGCSLYYKFFKKESSYYTALEIEILEKTLSLVEFNHGYDIDFEIDHVYRESHSVTAPSGRGDEIFNALKQFDVQDVISFYEKIYRLRCRTELMMNEFFEDEDWTEYTYFQKYLLPPLELYHAELEKQVFRLSPEYSAAAPVRKKALLDMEEKNL